jgi:ATP-dependent Clp protease, protease subunit
LAEELPGAGRRGGPLVFTSQPREAGQPTPPAALFRPHARLDGLVGDEMLRSFRGAMDAAEDGEEPFVVELTTTGGDADTARRIATDLRLFRERTGRPTLFFGKAIVYSAGVTIMAGAPREDRWLARGTSLLIHSRTISLDLKLDGPLAQERRRLKFALAQIDEGLRLQRDGFRQLIAGSDVSEAELNKKARTHWYLDAEAALARGLIAGVV